MEHAGMKRYFRHCFDSSLEEPSGEPQGTFEGASNVLLSPQRSSIYILNALKMFFYKGVTRETVFRVGNCFVCSSWGIPDSPLKSVPRGSSKGSAWRTPNGATSIFFPLVSFLWPNIPCGPSLSTNLTYARRTTKFTSTRSLSFVLRWTIISFTFPWWTSVRQNTFPEEQENRLLSKCAFGTHSGM